MSVSAHPAKTPRPFIEAAVLTAVAVLLVSTWYLRAFVVAGPSMAQTIMGAHHRLVCGACGYEFCCAADGAEMPGRRAICPNCGAAGPRLDTAPQHAGGAIVFILCARTDFTSRPRRAVNGYHSGGSAADSSAAGDQRRNMVGHHYFVWSSVSPRRRPGGKHGGACRSIGQAVVPRNRFQPARF